MLSDEFVRMHFPLYFAVIVIYNYNDFFYQ